MDDAWQMGYENQKRLKCNSYRQLYSLIFPRLPVVDGIDIGET